jgi:tape measure domain-containing protein
VADVAKTVSILFEGQDKGATATAAALSKSLQGVADASGLTAKQIEQSAVAEAKWSASAVKASQDAKALADAQDKLGDSAETAGRKSDRLADGLKAVAASLVTKAFIDANVSFETFEKSMTQILGSTEKARAEFKFLSDESNRLGLNVADASKAYIGLTAATKGTVLEGQATRDIFTAVSAAMATLGRSSSDTEGALKAIEQIASKGKVSMEELRSQLGDRLPQALPIAARALGVGVEALDDLVKSGVSANDFLPKFAAEINRTFSLDTEKRISGFNQELARTQNAVSAAFVELGKAGVFDAFQKGLQVATAAVIGSVASFKLAGEVIAAFLAAAVNGDFSQFGDNVSESFKKATDTVRTSGDAILNWFDSSEKAADGAKKLSGSLGIDDIEKYGKAQEVAAAAVDKASESSKKQVDALAKQAAETKRAEEAAQKYGLEIKKLENDLAGKVIEAQVKLNVAQLEADTKRIEAAFNSINSVIGDTNDLIGNLFGILANPNLDWAQIRAIEDQINKENDIKKGQLELQRALTEAQIKNLNAQTANLQKGDALIKIDGAGLQPHLEAFMWEILKKIQTRVNQDGLKLLLGV